MVTRTSYIGSTHVILLHVKLSYQENLLDVKLRPQILNVFLKICFSTKQSQMSWPSPLSWINLIVISKKIEKCCHQDHIWLEEGIKITFFNCVKCNNVNVLYYYYYCAIRMLCMVYWNVAFQIKKCYLWWDFHGPMNSSNAFQKVLVH